MVALAVISLGGAAMAMLPGLTEVIAFGSASFLAIYTLVNYLQARMATKRFDRAAAWFATVACVGAIAALGVELAHENVAALVVLVASVVFMGFARLLYASRQGSAAPGD